MTPFDVKNANFDRNDAKSALIVIRGSIIINHPGSITYDILPDLVSQISAVLPDVKIELVQIKQSQEVEMLKAYEPDLSYSRIVYEDEFLSSQLIPA